MLAARYVMVAPVGDDPDALFVGLREFPTKKVVLIAPKERVADAARLRRDLERFKIPVQIVELSGDLLEGMFDILSSLKRTEGDESMIINVATGDRLSTCAALSASYVNGLKAFTIVGDQPMLLPMLKFSYSKIISGKKTEILKILSDGAIAFDELAKRARISLPLLSYHLNGDRETSGLIELGLVEVSGEARSRRISLSTLGRLFVKGHLR